MSSEREQLKVKIAEKMGWGVVPSEGPGYGYYVTGYPSTEEMWIDAEDDLNNLTDACMEVLQAAKAEAQLRREIKIHDEYWHSQRLVSENGIGPVALANKEAAEMQLAQLTTPKEDKETE